MQLAAVAIGQQIHARAADKPVTVNKVDSMAWHLQATAAKLCHQFRPVAASRFGVQVLALLTPTEN